jgi:hypothetical protein
VISTQTAKCDQCPWTKEVEAKFPRAITLSAETIERRIQDAKNAANRALYYHKKAKHHGTSDPI